MDVPSLVEASQLVAIGGAAFAGAGLASAFEKVRVSPQSYVVTTLVPVGLAWALAPLPLSLGAIWWTLVLVFAVCALGLIDAKTRTVPDAISVPMIALGVLHAAQAGAPHLLFGMAAVGLILLCVLFRYVRRGGVPWAGGGDVLLLAGAIAWFGPWMIPDLLIITGILLLIRFAWSSLPLPDAEACIPRKITEGSYIALAPALGTAQLAVWMGGPLF